MLEKEGRVRWRGIEIRYREKKGFAKGQRKVILKGNEETEG